MLIEARKRGDMGGRYRPLPLTSTASFSYTSRAMSAVHDNDSTPDDDLKMDLEKVSGVTKVQSSTSATGVTPGVVAYQTRWAKLLFFLEGNGMESRGLERVQEDERVPVRLGFLPPLRVTIRPQLTPRSSKTKKVGRVGTASVLVQCQHGIQFPWNRMARSGVLHA